MHDVERLSAVDIGTLDGGAATRIEPFMGAMMGVLETPSPCGGVGFAGGAAKGDEHVVGVIDDIHEVIMAMAIRPSTIFGVSIDGYGLRAPNGEGGLDMEDADGVAGFDIFAVEVCSKKID